MTNTIYHCHREKIFDFRGDPFVKKRDSSVVSLPQNDVKKWTATLHFVSLAVTNLLLKEKEQDYSLFCRVDILSTFHLRGKVEFQYEILSIRNSDEGIVLRIEKNVPSPCFHTFGLTSS